MDALHQHKRDKVAIAVFFFAALNLNHVFLQLSGIPRVLWPIAVCLALLICLRYARLAAIGNIFTLFTAFFGSYLLFATFTALANAHVEWILLASYLTTFVFVSAFYFWLFDQNDADRAANLRTFKVLLLLSSFATLLSPYLKTYVGFTGERASGLFENPNEAATAALYSLVLVAAYPARSYLTTGLQAAIAILALILTFSKSALLVLLLLMCLALAGRRSIATSVLAAVGLVTVIYGIGFVNENAPFNLGQENRERLGAVSHILSGEITPETTTGRTLLWQFAWGKLELQLPWGAGIGEFHHMEGGYRNTRKEWLGSHNFFLMILGESGLLPFALLIAFIISLFAGAYRSRERTVAIGFAVIVVGEMFSSDSLLGSRLSSIALAVSMAIAARANMERQVPVRMHLR